jgi:hypothetical protein
VLATAIFDRLLHKSHVLDIRAGSYRLRDLEHACRGPHDRRGLWRLPGLPAPRKS